MDIVGVTFEKAIVHPLDMCAKRGFHVLLRIVGNLLELVDSEDTGLVGLLQIADLFSSVRTIHDVSLSLSQK